MAEDQRDPSVILTGSNQPPVKGIGLWLPLLSACRSIRTDFQKFGFSDTVDCPRVQTLKLAKTPTRLQKQDSITQERLINWGYAVCDAALRSHVDSSLSAPQGFPSPHAKAG
jgi:hypothetical protein